MIRCLGEEMPLASSGIDIGRTFVRVLGTRHDRFVEFEFTINDRDLTIELIMPFDAFREFCETNRCDVVAADGSAQVALERLAWRAGHPGLYRRPHDMPEPQEGAAPDAADPAES